MCHHSIDKFTLPITTITYYVLFAIITPPNMKYSIDMTSTQKNWKEKHQKVGIKCQTSKAYKGGCFEIVRYIFSEVSLFSGSSSRHKYLNHTMFIGIKNVQKVKNINRSKNWI